MANATDTLLVATSITQKLVAFNAKE